MVTAAQQGQPAAFGFADPALYQLAGTGALHDALPVTGAPRPWTAAWSVTSHDCGAVGADSPSMTRARSMFGYTGQVTLPGYDNMTGIGTPAGRAFITGLRSVG